MSSRSHQILDLVLANFKPNKTESNYKDRLILKTTRAIAKLLTLDFSLNVCRKIYSKCR